MTRIYILIETDNKDATFTNGSNYYEIYYIAQEYKDSIKNYTSKTILVEAVNQIEAFKFFHNNSGLKIFKKADKNYYEKELNV